ncbi:MAG: hypothetical protein MMC33_000926 [Icmadophila ericetorum]|nr:hypothetical protein [Icmadophila ericetorum]
MEVSSDLEVLVSMGFERTRAELAVKKSGGRQYPIIPDISVWTFLIHATVQGAIDWLEQVQDKSIEEINASAAKANTTTIAADDDDPNAEPPALKAGEVAHSLVCNDCGKKFRSQAQAEFHASKTQHVDFSESTEEIAPLTEEEKKAKLEELRLKLKGKREGMSEQDKLDKKKNEEIRRKSTKETQDLKEELAKKEQIKEAQAKRREKQAEAAAKEKIKAKIAADKEERRLKAEKDKAEREGRAPVIPSASTPAPTTSGPVASKPASAYTETRMRFQTPSGNIQKSFPVETTLFEVAVALNTESGLQVQSFLQNFPKRIYDQADFGATLKELGLVPSASLIVK